MLQDWHIMLIVLGIFTIAVSLLGALQFGLKSVAPYFVGVIIGAVIGGIIGALLFDSATRGACGGIAFAYAAGVIAFCVKDWRRQKERNARLYPKKYQ